MIELKLYNKQLSPYFDTIIALLVLMFIAVLFIPKSLWSLEDSLREQCRIRMENLYELEIEFYRLVNRFPESPEEAMRIVNMVLDSARADTSFYDAETLRVDNMVYPINILGDIVARLDTLMTLPITEELFSCPFVHERYVIDTENKRTIYIACPIRQEINPFKITLIETDDSLRSLYTEIIQEKNYELKTFTSIHEVLPLQEEWKPELILIDDRTINDETLGIVDQLFDNDEDVLVLLMMQMEPAHTEAVPDSLDSSVLPDSSEMAVDSAGVSNGSDPVESAEVVEIVGRNLPIVSATVPYSFTLGDLKDKVDELVLLSPRRWLREDYYERKYLVFTMVDSIHGFIEDGDRSWLSRQ